MSHWNYRTTVHRKDDWLDEYAVREIHYDDNGNVKGWTGEPATASGETREELLADLAQIASDAAKWPILNITDPDNPVWEQP